MANCNCNDFPISCAPHAPGGCPPHGCPPHPVCPPPDYKGGTSMYIGARYVPIFADPVEWDDEREYEPLTIVVYNGDMYTSKCYVPKGAQLPPYPNNQTKYWVKTADYNYQFADLKKTVTDLSRLVEQFQKDNETFTELINGWNATVKEWTAKMDEWQGQMDDFKQSVADLTAKLDDEIQRAKDAEHANAAAIAKETADREQAISELDAAYKAADTAIREDFTAADAAEKAAREAADAQLTADIAAEKDRAEGQETAIRGEFAAADAAEKAARETADNEEAQARADADTALSDRITANKADIDSIKAEQIIQNTNISANAKNISDNAAEIAKHAERLTDLESNASDWDSIFPDTTIAQEVQKEELARANADTAINGRLDAQAADIEEVRDLANHKVDITTYTEGQTAQDNRIDALESGKADKTDLKDWVLSTTYEAGQAAQDAKITAAQETADLADGKADANAALIGDWNTAHPEQTISECVKSVEDSAAANAAAIAKETTDRESADSALDTRVTALENAPGPDLSAYVLKTTYNTEQTAQNTKINAITDEVGDWATEFPAETVASVCKGTRSSVDSTKLDIGDWTAFQTKYSTENDISEELDANRDYQRTTSGSVSNLSTRVKALEDSPGPDLSGYVLKTTYDAAVGDVAGVSGTDKPLADIVGSASQYNDNSLSSTIGPWKNNYPSSNIASMVYKTDHQIGNWGSMFGSTTIATTVSNVETRVATLEKSSSELPDTISATYPAPPYIYYSGIQYGEGTRTSIYYEYTIPNPYHSKDVSVQVSISSSFPAVVSATYIGRASVLLENSAVSPTINTTTHTDYINIEIVGTLASASGTSPVGPCIVQLAAPGSSAIPYLTIAISKN